MFRKMKTKGYLKWLVVSLALIVSFYNVNIHFLSSNAAQLVRTVSLNEAEVDYQSFFNEFDNAELLINEENNSLKFSGSQQIDSSLFDEIDLVSLTGQESGPTIHYEFTYLADDNLFILSAIAESVENGEIIDNLIGVPFLTESGEIDICFNADGTIILLSELQSSGLLNNCGWLSSVLKTVVKVAAVVAIAAAVAVVVIVAAPVVVTAGAAIASAAVSVGGGALAMAGATATATIATVAATGTASIAGSALAIATTTLAVASATVLIGNYVLDCEDNYEFATGIYKSFPLPASIAADITNISNDPIYQFAYVDTSGVKIMETPILTYIEAYVVLVRSSLVTIDRTGSLKNAVLSFIPEQKIVDLINIITSIKKISLYGIYTPREADAAKLAYAAGGWAKDRNTKQDMSFSEVHDASPKSNQYNHFHDAFHAIHVWYGEKY
jgi:hypothetical protein